MKTLIIKGIPVVEHFNYLYLLLASCAIIGILLAEGIYTYKRSKGDRIYNSFFNTFQGHKITTKK